MAALSHFGLPAWSVFLPLIIWALSPPGSFRRDHARRAFAFQCVFLGLWVLLVIGMATYVLPVWVLLAAVGAALVAEVLQAALALRGLPPRRFPPFDLLTV